MKSLSLRSAAYAAIVLSLTTVCNAATKDTQSFSVTVPASVSIIAPAAVAITHDETNNPQAFPPQAWVVKGNATNGVSVSFSTATPFIHETDSTFKRNAKLDLAVATTQGPAQWTIGTASDMTNYVNDDGIAVVTASSNGVGRANLNLTVSFITEEFGVFAAGVYTTTVTGTVAAN